MYQEEKKIISRRKKSRQALHYQKFVGCLQNRLINPLKRYIFEYILICSDRFLNEVLKIFLCGVDKAAKRSWVPAPAALGSASCFLSAGNTVRRKSLTCIYIHGIYVVLPYAPAPDLIKGNGRCPLTQGALNQSLCNVQLANPSFCPA